MAKQYKDKKEGSNELITFLSEERGLKPPQAIELEEAIIGAVMIERDAIHEVIDILKPESFYKESHQMIFEAIMELHARMDPIDLYTVGNRLDAKKQLETIGGAIYLAELTERVGSASHIVSHAKIVAQKYIQRELIRAATEIQKTSFDDTKDIDDLIDIAEGEIFKVSEGHIKKDVRKAYDIVAEALRNIEIAGKNVDGMNGIPTGFTELDKITSGWQSSDLIIIAARPAMGKTAFVLSMARNATIDFKKPVAVFSLEMGDVQLITRLIVSESSLDSTKVKTGQLGAAEWKHLQDSIVQLSEAPLYIDDTPALSIFEFRSKARRLKAQYDVQMIIVDYLQLMTGPTDMRGNREQEVAAISRSLKSIAKELNIPIIALSQLSRSVEQRGGNKRPQLSDLRESGAIEQDADIVAFIHRPEYYGIKVDEDGNEYPEGTAEIIIAKHRNGSLADVR
ncbi:MAG: replicative DNA helicase, partial [Rikenellaceae bacterium]